MIETSSVSNVSISRRTAPVALKNNDLEAMRTVVTRQKSRKEQKREQLDIAPDQVVL